MAAELFTGPEGMHQLDPETGLMTAWHNLSLRELGVPAGYIDILKGANPLDEKHSLIEEQARYVKAGLFKALHEANLSFLQRKGFRLIQDGSKGWLFSKETAYQTHRKTVSTAYVGAYTEISLAALPSASGAPDALAALPGVEGEVHMETKVLHLGDGLMQRDIRPGLYELILRESEPVRAVLGTDFSIYTFWEKHPGRLVVQVYTRFCAPATSSRSAEEVHNGLAGIVKRLESVWGGFLPQKK